MKIEPIIYETTRGIYNLEDKLSITSLILFSWNLGSKVFAELLYTDNIDLFISYLDDKYESYEIDLNVRLEDKQIRETLEKTILKLREKEDPDGYLKALYNRDEFAIAINEIVNCDFSDYEFKKSIRQVNKQLELFSNNLSKNT